MLARFMKLCSNMVNSLVNYIIFNCMNFFCINMAGRGVGAWAGAGDVDV